MMATGEATQLRDSARPPKIVSIGVVAILLASVPVARGAGSR
jgi:hypothetical protein